MHLDDWIKLTPEERQAYRHLWDSNPEEMSDYWEFYDELNSRLMSEYGQHPNIMDIVANPDKIHITTDLPKGELIPDFPTDYFNFPMIKEQIGEEIQAFKDVWTAQLSQLFSWREECIAECIETKDYVWRNSWFLHDPPSVSSLGDTFSRKRLMTRFNALLRPR